MTTIFHPSTLPARAILFGDSSSLEVQRIRETDTSKDGAAFSPYWISPIIWREQPDRLASLSLLTLWTTARGATTITVEASGNGGSTWVAPSATPVSVASGETYMDAVSMSFDGVIGTEICFRVTFDTTTIVIVHHWRAHIVVRGPVEHG